MPIIEYLDILNNVIFIQLTWKTDSASQLLSAVMKFSMCDISNIADATSRPWIQ